MYNYTESKSMQSSAMEYSRHNPLVLSEISMEFVWNSPW